MTNFPSEHIPDEENLYYRIHKVFFKDNAIQPSAFTDKGNGMSMDWQKYSTPEESQIRSKVKADNGIVSFSASAIRSLNLNLIHSPSKTNRAHSEAIGKKEPQIRVELARMATWQIKISK